MPYTTTFPPGLPNDLEQLLRDLHASTERMLEEATLTNRLLNRLALYPPHALHAQPWILSGLLCHCHTCPILMVPDLLLPLALRRNLSVHQGQLTPSSIGCAPGKQASASFMSAFHPCFRHFPGLCVFLMGFQFPFSLSPFPLLSVAL